MSATTTPYSEAQFKTLKYRQRFPRRFDSIEAARARVRCAELGELAEDVGPSDSSRRELRAALARHGPDVQTL
jgi:hypothetical protein